MTRIYYDYEFDFENCLRSWQYEPNKNSLKDALIEIILEKFDINDDGGIEAINKLCYRNDDLTYELARYYEPELTEYFKDIAKEDFEDNYIPPDYTEWDEWDAEYNRRCCEYDN